MFFAIVLSVLVYRANQQSSIRTYIFQINNLASQRIGALQDINNMSAIELRNKLIRTYVSEYFRVTPGESNVTERPLLKRLSRPDAFDQWKEIEASKIQEMSDNRAFRRVVNITDADIAPMNLPEGYNYYNAKFTDRIWYKVHYYTETWNELNCMGVKPLYESGFLYIEASFKPGVIQDITDSSQQPISIRNYLESGQNPMGLFMFEVWRIGDETNQ